MKPAAASPQPANKLNLKSQTAQCLGPDTHVVKPADESFQPANLLNSKSQPAQGTRADTASKQGKKENARDHCTDEVWHDMIATAAYYRAEKRGFEGGSPEQDWYEAEAELRERFGRGGGI